jgi:co-chaperonin GroES (HSP10)
MSEETKFFLEPWGNRIVIKEDDAPNMIGLIIVPDGAKRRSTVGTIVALSPGAIDEGFKVGERIFCAQFSGTGVSFRGKPLYRILSTDEVLAKVTESDVELMETTA